MASAFALLASLPAALAAQDTGRALRYGAGVHAIGIVTRVDPALDGRAMTEAYLTQPFLIAHAEYRVLRLAATLNFEGATLEDGELAPGNSGEGFVDKRHPHTWLHELVLSASVDLAGSRVSLTGGRGFAPFGTDDPMVRPFVKYPANHHWSHVLERWLLVAAARYGPLALEGGLFSGNEPAAPDDVSGLDRFADSWAARITLEPVPALELQCSHARVESPELEFGGIDQRKYSVSARVDHTLASGRSLYALFEWAETHEYSDDVKAFIFTSALAETALNARDWKVALRYERTTRPEEERLADRFRTPRPHTDESILGVTRWNTVTAHAARSFSWSGLALQPFGEIAHSSVAEITNSVLVNPVELYGSDRLWSLSFGLRLSAGSGHTRMGRYGAALNGPIHVPAHASH